MWRGELGHEASNPYNTGHMCLLEGKCLILPSQKGTFILPARYRLAARC
jgi:hypothetical protein